MPSPEQRIADAKKLLDEWEADFIETGRLPDTDDYNIMRSLLDGRPVGGRNA